MVDIYKHVDARKAVEIVLYILNRECQNMYNVLKVIYFADKTRLGRVGTTMYKEIYKAMEAGAVPSFAYSLFQLVRDGEHPNIPFVQSDATSNMYRPLRQAQTKLLSKVDMKCLNENIELYGNMPYSELRKEAHRQEDYNAVPLNCWIPNDVLLASVDKDGKIKEYLETVVD